MTLSTSPASSALVSANPAQAASTCHTVSLSSRARRVNERARLPSTRKEAARPGNLVIGQFLKLICKVVVVAAAVLMAAANKPIDFAHSSSR